MLFSEHFGITRDANDDWLDIILDNDTKLWVDPFLIFREEKGFWQEAHARIIQHFQTCFDLIAEGGMRDHTVPYKKALALLTFKEPKEFCLGHTAFGTDGAGGGSGYAKMIAKAMVEAINRGLSDLEHFEELGILEKGIGPDRVSDLTCNILKERFIEYTKEVAKRHSLETTPQLILNARYDTARKRWENVEHHLPVNPSNGDPIILTPQRFIRDKPTLNAEAWFDAYQSEQIRVDVNYEVLHKVDKKLIVETARTHAQEVRDWTEEQSKNAAAQPYDIEADPNGVYQWDAATRAFVKANPLALTAPNNIDEFIAIIREVIREYRNYIEEGRGWELLWNDDGSEKDEEAAQLTFKGIARSYCKQNDIVVDREVELGRGPVDFKFSNGYKFRALLEMKKLTSGKFWQGLESQLPTYLTGDQCDLGWYIAVRYRPGGISKIRGPRLPAVIAKLQEESGITVNFDMIDATSKVSASKVKKNKS
jgi:hypothetical protein